MAIEFEVVTLFPAMIEAQLSGGVVKRALDSGLARVGCVDPRAFAKDAHRTVDDRPYGGGPGMVMKPDVVALAIDEAMRRLPQGSRRVYLSAQGRRFDQNKARQVASWPGVMLLAGRYEGVDERLIESHIDEEWSIGDVILTGGELPAGIVIDAVVRLLPGALNDEESALQDSFALTRPILDWPHYTRPEQWQGREVPSVLREGNHAAIARYRLKQALGRTFERRPDLLEGLELSREERELLREYVEEMKL